MGAISDEQLNLLRQDVVANPRIYGPLVSPDMKVALIKAQLNEGQLDYEQTFAQLQAVREAEARARVNIYATGQPVLVGWVYTKNRSSRSSCLPPDHDCAAGLPLPQTLWCVDSPRRRDCFFDLGRRYY